MPFLLVRNDITKMKVDAIVNPSNTRLIKGEGTSTAVFEAAGELRLAAACRLAGKCDVGSAVMTGGFKLPAKHIIHAVGPVWQGGDKGEKQLLYNAYMTSLKLAAKKGLESIAFPLLSSGSYGYPKNEALKVAVTAINDFIFESDSEMMVYLVVYDRKSLSVSQKIFDSIDGYIDDNYVKEHPYREMPREHARMRREAEYMNYHASMPAPDDDADLMQPCMMSAVPASIDNTAELYDIKELSLDSMLEEMGETFADMLLRLIDERGMTDAQAYKKANIDRKLFNKIKNNPGYTPTKKTILAFAIALELTREEADQLLMKAGYAFSNSSKFDLIVAYFIMNRKYDMFEINEVLFAYDQPLLGM